ncbi:hypothetical protein K9M79_06970 [Candidatus Woesearchaeota archaeon]|nr:hypothetical protein [Candidatus Woesearchaeota archaeon]
MSRLKDTFMGIIVPTVIIVIGLTIIFGMAGLMMSLAAILFVIPIHLGLERIIKDQSSSIIISLFLSIGIVSSGAYYIGAALGNLLAGFCITVILISLASGLTYWKTVLKE